MPLIMSPFRAILSYIAFGFIEVFGTITAFFWFHAFLAALIVYLVYLLIFRISKSVSAAMLGVFLATIYVDYHLLVPVLYYQIFEIFFTLLILYLLLLLIDCKNNNQAILIILGIVFLLYTSLLFRGTLKFFYFNTLILGFLYLLKRDYRNALKFTLVFVLMYTALAILPLSHYTMNKKESSSNFLFFGHTLYGGDGGEGAFIYKQNRELYEHRLQEYMIKNKIDTATVKVLDDFKNEEIKIFVTKHPFQWGLLQLRKIVFTYGVIPIKDNLIILKTGKLGLGMMSSAAIIQFPFVVIILLFIGMFAIAFRIRDLNDSKIALLLLSTVYLICATSLYGHYQERYRIVVVMSGFIPISSIYCKKFIDSIKEHRFSRLRMICAIVIVVTVILFWGWQGYNAIFVNPERFMHAV